MNCIDKFGVRGVEPGKFGHILEIGFYMEDKVICNFANLYLV